VPPPSAKSKTFQQQHRCAACEAAAQPLVDAHGHDHEHHHHAPEDPVALRRRLHRSILAALIFVLALLLTQPAATRPPLQTVQLIFFACAYLLVGFDVLAQAARNIIKGQIFDENFLMSLATAGAIVIGEYPEAVAVMLLYQIGEYFQGRALDQSRRSIAALLDIRPDFANLEQDGEVLTVSPEEVQIGDIILVRPGEKVPLDGTVIEGSARLDTAALTGESVLRSARPGDALLSGSINMNGLLRVKVDKVFAESTVARILELVEHARHKKSKSEAFISRFAKVYTPIVVIAALLLAFLPPLLLPGATLLDWGYRSLNFLVVSCPCALVISIPLAFFGGIGGASRSGILVKGGNYLELLSRADTVVFDKTGTLTEGVFEVREMHPVGLTAEELLELAAVAEQHSSHPIALSLQEAYADSRSVAVSDSQVAERSLSSDYKEITGRGIQATIDGQTVLVGNRKWMEENQIPHDPADADGTVVHVAADREYKGFIRIADRLKPDAPRAIRDLRAAGIRQVVLLSGDHESGTQAVGRALKMDAAYGELLPADKIDRLESLMADKDPQRSLLFVGDGINDAPVLARADVGIAMGGLGADAAVEAADVVLMTDEPGKIATALRIARKTVAIARQNTVFALGIKIAILLLSTLGKGNLWLAVFADVGVAVLATLNATRALRVDPIRKGES
jgi:Cd2+/Zn2+-exporting ATPase